MHLVMH